MASFFFFFGLLLKIFCIFFIKYLLVLQILIFVFFFCLFVYYMMDYWCFFGLFMIIWWIIVAFSGLFMIILWIIIFCAIFSNVFYSLNQCNAICLWVDWFLDGVRHAKTVISTGPSRPVVVGEIVTWDMFTSQGVYFLTDNSKDLEILHIDWTLYFNTNFGVVTKFSIQRKDSKSNKA